MASFQIISSGLGSRLFAGLNGILFPKSGNPCGAFLTRFFGFPTPVYGFSAGRHGLAATCGAFLAGGFGSVTTRCGFPATPHGSVATRQESVATSQELLTTAHGSAASRHGFLTTTQGAVTVGWESLAAGQEIAKSFSAFQESLFELQESFLEAKTRKNHLATVKASHFWPVKWFDWPKNNQQPRKTKTK